MPGKAGGAESLEQHLIVVLGDAATDCFPIIKKPNARLEVFVESREEKSFSAASAIFTKPAIFTKNNK